MRTSLSEVDLKCHAPKNDASLATDKQSNAGVVLGVKTKTNLTTETREEGKTLFKMAAKHQTTISCYKIDFSEPF